MEQDKPFGILEFDSDNYIWFTAYRGGPWPEGKEVGQFRLDFYTNPLVFAAKCRELADFLTKVTYENGSQTYIRADID